MMMSGKQYSLDSRIDLVEAVQASQDEEDQENVARTEDTGMINLEGEVNNFDTSVLLKKSGETNLEIYFLIVRRIDRQYSPGPLKETEISNF